MLKSMTAYGRGVLTAPLGQFVVEIQSVKRKHLEIQVSLPRELAQFDIELKKWLGLVVARGQVAVKVSAAFQGPVPFVVRPNLSLARQLKDAWDQIAQELQLDENAFSLALLRGTEDLLSFEENRAEEEHYRQLLKQSFEMALKSFTQMKEQEGAVLQNDILGRLEKMRISLSSIEVKAPHATSRHREKLIARLEEILPGRIENEERILREIALFAEKIDITEEITRFKCHLTHAEELIHSGERSVGKTLEFLVQELNREANTIGSKSSELEIARAVIDIKSELERIREQIQNIE